MITKRCLFIHIPRTGGTAIETAFGNIKGHHHDETFYRDSYPDHYGNPERVYKFTIIREPIDRAASLYAYWRNVSQAEWFGRIDKKASLKNAQESAFRERVSDVDAFVKLLPKLAEETWTDCHFRPQCEFLCDPTELDLVRFDQLGERWPEIAEKAGIPGTPLLRRNASPTKGKPDFSPRLRSLVKEFYHKDVELWNELTKRA